MPSPRIIPSIELLAQRPESVALADLYGRHVVVDALRSEAARLRQELGQDGPWRGPEPRPESADSAGATITARAATHLAAAFAPSLRPVINATGVIVHTNLGRAPLAPAALRRVAEVASGYANVEYDLEAGQRGRRDVHAEALLRRITGAESAVVVNNNAGATLLMLAALARGREVIISRGELVEIGGGFRVPDVMAQSGAILREVGTTNRTRAADYAAAIGDRTALILRVHPSNFRIEGFTERAAPGELVALGRRFGVPVLEDVGSGNLGATPAAAPHARERAPEGVTGAVAEPTVQESVAHGFDVVCFSGDKMLGGPQAGILVGRTAPIETIRRHPLMRALRVDKMTYAALEATLVEHATGRANRSVPVLAMMAASVDGLRARAERLAQEVRSPPHGHASIADGASMIGGGSAPGIELPTCVVRLTRDGWTPDALGIALRALATPVVARIERDAVVLDLRTVLPEQDGTLARAIAALLRSS